MLSGWFVKPALDKVPFSHASSFYFARLLTNKRKRYRITLMMPFILPFLKLSEFVRWSMEFHGMPLLDSLLVSRSNLLFCLLPDEFLFIGWQWRKWNPLLPPCQTFSRVETFFKVGLSRGRAAELQYEVHTVHHRLLCLRMVSIIIGLGCLWIIGIDWVTSPSTLDVFCTHLPAVVWLDWLSRRVSLRRRC